MPPSILFCFSSEPSPLPPPQPIQKKPFVHGSKVNSAIIPADPEKRSERKMCKAEKRRGRRRRATKRRSREKKNCLSPVNQPCPCFSASLIRLGTNKSPNFYPPPLPPKESYNQANSARIKFPQNNKQSRQATKHHIYEDDEKKREKEDEEENCNL